jgi:hypothetical protein
MSVDKHEDGTFTVTITTPGSRKAAEECDRAIAEYMHEIIGDRDGDPVTIQIADMMHEKIDAAGQAIIDAVNDAKRSAHRQLNEQVRYMLRYGR